MIRRWARFASLWLVAGCALALAACSAPSPSIPSVSEVSAAEVGKLIVDRPGPVAVTRADLRAIGWGAVPLDQVQVTYRDQVQPVWVVDADTLRFYADITPTRYMTSSVYFLRRGPSLAMTNTPAVTGGSSSDVYTATVHTEQNKTYAPQAAGDTWFWERLIAPSNHSYSVTLSAVATGPATLRIETWSSTEGPGEIDHRAQVSVNGQAVGESAWDGSVRRTLEYAVPAGVLHDGDNTVQINLPGETGVLADTIYLDWIEVSFPRRFEAESDRLMFDSPGGPLKLIGFSGPIDVYDVTQPDRITRVSIDASSTQATPFVSTAGHRYWAVGPRGYSSGRVMAAAVAPDLHAVQADYIAIGPIDLIKPLQPLLEYHAAHGLTTAAVPDTAVYDQFGDGRVDPAAIQAFLRAAKPKYVLLVGDASYDPLGYTAPPEANRLPTLLVTTVFGGETGSDVGFATPADDLKPVLAVGRVPARTADQVKVFVDKTLAYLTAPVSGAWRQRVLAVADGQDANFKTEAQAFLDKFAPAYQTQLINPKANQPDANVPIVAALNEGYALVGYFGHGSVTQWGKDNLFTVADGSALKNDGTLPVILNFTCLTGLFTHPKVQSLAETLLWQMDGTQPAGAVAVLAPTSLTLGSDQSFLSQALVDEFLANPTERLGDLVLKARQTIPVDAPGTRDVLQTFLLFGDPALSIVSK